jgi:hydroxymethylpyrimidine/phosphomethylpyrimidine kinase
LLLLPGGELTWTRAPRIHSANTHGTGCTLSSAIAAHLALGASLLDAVQAARAFVRAALEAGVKVRTGAGSGPLNHGHAPRAMRFLPLP